MNDLNPIHDAGAFTAWFVAQGKDPRTADLYLRVLRTNQSGRLAPSRRLLLSTAQRAWQKFTLGAASHQGVTRADLPAFTAPYTHPPRWALHAAAMLGNVLGRYLDSPLLPEKNRRKYPNSSVQVFSRRGWAWPAAVAKLSHAYLNWEWISPEGPRPCATLSAGPGCNPPLHDDLGYFWGIWVIRLLYYNQHTDIDRQEAMHLPLLPTNPKGWEGFTPSALQALWQTETQNGALAFRQSEGFPELGILRAREETYIHNVAVAIRDQILAQVSAPDQIAAAHADYDKARQFYYHLWRD